MPEIKNIMDDISGIKIPDKKLRILHLEDLSSDAVLIGKALKKGKIDFERLVVDTRDKFIKALKEFSPDIILADHSLPSFNSLDALEIFHKTKMQIPFILVTATISEEFVVDMIKQGADDYILKDRLSRLPIAIKHALEKFRLKKKQQDTFEELINNEKKYHALVENGTDGIVILTAEGNPTYVSQSACRILGYTEQEALQLNMFALIHPDDREITAERMNVCLLSPAIPLDKIIGRVKHKDGSWRWMETTMTNMLHDPAINGIVENFRDITDRKLTEIDLLESREEMQTVFNASLDAVIIIDEEGKIIKWDPKAELLFGWKQEEVFGTLLSDNIIPPRFREAHKQGMKHFLKTGEGIFLNKTVEVHALKKDATEIDISLSICPTRVKNKYQFIGFIRDISERKVAEEALRKSESNLHAIFENTSDGFILSDINGVIKSFNSKARDRILLNIDQEIAVGKSIYDFLPDSRKKMYKENISKVLSGEILQYDYPYTRKTGETKWFSFTINPVYSARVIEGISFKSTDITAKKIAIEMLQQSEQRYRDIAQEMQLESARLIEAQSIAKVGSWETDLQTYNIKWSEETHRIFETDPKNFQVTYESFLDFVHPDDRNILNIALENSLYSKSSTSIEHRIISRNGTVKHVLENWKSFQDGEGNPVRAVGTCQDITERKITEERLIASEIKLKEAQALGHISNWEVNLVTSVHTWSDEFYNIFGINREDVTPSAESFLSLLHPDDMSYASERIAKAFQTNEAGSFNSRFIKKDGSIGYIYTEWKFESKKNKKPVRLYGILQDITESRRAEEKIRTSKDSLAEAQRLAQMGSWNFDFERDILTWSEELYNVFDTDQETFIETHSSFLQLIDPIDREFALAVSKNTQATGVPFEIEYNITTARGERRVIQERGYGEKDKHGNVLRLFGTAQNITERKKSELELKASEEKYRSFFDNNMDGILLTVTDGEILAANPAACHMFQMTEEEILKKGRFGLVDPTDKRFPRGIKERQEYGKTKVEITFVRKDETTFPGEVAATVFKNSNGEKRTSLIIRDLTEFKESQKEISELQSNLQSIFNNTSEGIILTDTGGIVKTFNNTAKDVILNNVNAKIFVGSSIFDYIHDDRKENYKKLVSNVLSGETINYDHSYGPENKRTWINFTLNPVFNSGKIEGICITGTDITKRKKAENKLNATSIELESAVADLHKILDSSLDVICTVNANGEFVMVSAASQQVWGYTPEELIGSKFINLVYDEDVDSTLKAAEQIVSDFQVPMFENRYVHKNGRVVPILWSVNWDEKLQLMFCIAKDVTEKKRLEKAVETERDQFFEMFSKAPSAIGMLKGADHVFEIVNPPYLQLIGKNDVIGKTVAEVLPEVIEQGFIGILDSVYTTGISYIGTEALIKIDKEGNGELTDAYLNFIYQAYRNEEGNIEGIFFFANDVTEQILARIEIEKSEKFFKGVIENSADMITMLDHTGKTLYASPAVSRKFGYTQAECLDLNMADIMHPDDEAKIQEFVMEIMMHPGVPMDCPMIRERKKDGSYIWVEGTLTNFLETDGINAIVANFRDITERKIADENLIQSQKYSRNLFEQTAQGLALARMDGTFVDVNEAYAKIIGHTIEETLKLTYWDITPEKYFGQESRILDELMDTGKFIAYEKEYIHKNGKIVPIRLSGNIFEKDGEKFILSTVEDITERKKAEEKNRFKANLLSTIGQAAIATDLEGVVTYWNKAAENIYSWSQEEAIGKNIILLTPSHATREQALEIMADLKKGHTWSGEIKLQRKDGTDFPAFVTNTPIYDEHNKLSGIIGISSDITEKKKLEALLDKSNRLAVIGSWEIDVESGTVYWSDITKEIREVDKDYVPQLDIGISYFKEGSHKETIRQKITECIENGTPWDEELEILTFKGNHKWVRTIGEGEFVNGKCKMVYGSFQDITARKKAENEVIKAYEEKNIILESIGDAFFAVDKDSIVTYWNNKAEVVIGKKREEVIGKNIWEAFKVLPDSITYKCYQAAIKEKKEQHYETFSETLGKWLEVSAYPSNNGITGYFKDITERKLADIQLSALNLKLSKHVKDLAASNKELEEFAYVASHDLQEPLRMVTGFLGQIEKKYSDVIDDKGKQYLHFAVDGAKRMRQIILDLLEFSRIGRTGDTEKIVDLDVVLQEVLSLCQIQIKETKATIRFKNLPSVLVDQTALRQVFQNLVSNALKYHKKGIAPVINIAAEEKEAHWKFAVSDNGIGIDEEYFNKIFVIFQRLHNKEEYSGTGIGLAVCKKIIENLGGKIWLASVPEKGTTFYFTIPK